jgi:GTP pyrophosphokinase
MDDAVWERFKAGKEGTLWYYRALVDAFKKTNKNTKITQLTEELERVVTELETLVKV